MAGLNIKNPEVEAKIRELAALTGEGLTETVMNAVDARLEELRKNPTKKKLTREEKIAKANEIALRFKEAWRDKPMPTDDDIYGYMYEDDFAG